MMFGEPLGPWRDSRSEALQDALDQGHAERDEQYGATFLTVPAWIDQQWVAE